VRRVGGRGITSPTWMAKGPSPPRLAVRDGAGLWARPRHERSPITALPPTLRRVLRPADRIRIALSFQRAGCGTPSRVARWCVRMCLACRRPQYGHQAVDEHPHPVRGVVASELFVTAPGDHAAPGGQIVDPFGLETHLRVGLHRVPLHTVDGVSIDAAAVVGVASRHDIGHLPLIQPMPPITSLCRSCSISMGIENSEHRRHSFPRSPTRIALLRTCPNVRACR